MPISFFCVSTLLAFKCKRNPALLSEMKKFLFLLFSAAALLVTAVPSSRPGGALKHPLSRPSSLRGFLSPRRQVTEQSVLSLSIVLPATHSTLTHTHTHTHICRSRRAIAVSHDVRYVICTALTIDNTITTTSRDAGITARAWVLNGGMQRVAFENGVAVSTQHTRR